MRSLTGVVDVSAIVGVRCLQKRKKLFAILAITKPILELFKADVSISILVQGLEYFFQLFHVIWVGLDSNSC